MLNFVAGRRLELAVAGRELEAMKAMGGTSRFASTSGSLTSANVEMACRTEKGRRLNPARRGRSGMRHRCFSAVSARLVELS